MSSSFHPPSALTVIILYLINRLNSFIHEALKEHELNLSLRISTESTTFVSSWTRWCMDALRLRAHFSNSCFPVTLLDSRAVQGELGWVANPTEGGVSTAKKCLLVRTHGPLLRKNGEIISIIGRNCGLDRQTDTQALFDKILSWWALYENSFVDNLLCSCRGVSIRLRSRHNFQYLTLKYDLIGILLATDRGPMGSPEFILRTIGSIGTPASPTPPATISPCSPSL